MKIKIPSLKSEKIIYSYHCKKKKIGINIEMTSSSTIFLYEVILKYLLFSLSHKTYTQVINNNCYVN